MLLHGRRRRRENRDCWHREWSPHRFLTIEADLQSTHRASFDATARLWDVDAGTCLYTFARHSDFVYSISFSPGDGDYLATGSNDSKLNIWSVKVSLHSFVQFDGQV